MTQDTYAELCTTYTTFLTVVIHTLLFHRGCYPPASFLLARAYNHPVRQSRHPKVCAWVTDAVAAVHDQLLAGTLARVALVICAPRTAALLERFVFNLGRLPRVARDDLNALIVRDGAADREDVDVAESLRSVLAKLSSLPSRLAPVPAGCTFTLAIELRDDLDVDPPIGHPQPWIPARPSLQKTRLDFGKGETKEPQRERKGPRKRPVKLGRGLRGVKTVPIRSVDTGELIFEMWAEEGRAKSRLQMPPPQKRVKSKPASKKTKA